MSTSHVNPHGRFVVGSDIREVAQSLYDTLRQLRDSVAIHERVNGHAVAYLADADVLLEGLKP